MHNPQKSKLLDKQYELSFSSVQSATKSSIGWQEGIFIEGFPYPSPSKSWHQITSSHKVVEQAIFEVSLTPVLNSIALTSKQKCYKLL